MDSPERHWKLTASKVLSSASRIYQINRIGSVPHDKIYCVWACFPLFWQIYGKEIPNCVVKEKCIIFHLPSPVSWHSISVHLSGHMKEVFLAANGCSKKCFKSCMSHVCTQIGKACVEIRSFIQPFFIYCRRIPVTQKVYAYLYMAFFWVRRIP